MGEARRRVGIGTEIREIMVEMKEKRNRYKSINETRQIGWREQAKWRRKGRKIEVQAFSESAKINKYIKDLRFLTQTRIRMYN